MSVSEGRRPTGHDVAARAGVSQTAVSLVLRGAAGSRVSAETQQRVLDAAAELGYYPSEAGRSLRGATSGLVGLLVPDVTDPYFAAVMRGAEAGITRSGKVLTLMEGRSADAIERVVGAVLSYGMAGLIACTPTAAQLRRLAPVLDRTVLLDGYATAARACIEYDIADGMAQALDHLAGLGHERIGRISSDTNASTVRRRARVFDQHTGSGPTCAVAYPIDPAGAIAQIGEFLQAHGELTALVADTDMLAASAMAAAADLGKRVPDDLSVVGFNDIATARVVRPALTTIRIPAARAGELAAEVLLGEVPRHRIRLELTLSERGSTGPMSRSS